MSQHNRKGDRRQGGPAGWHAFYSARLYQFKLYKASLLSTSPFYLSLSLLQFGAERWAALHKVFLLPTCSQHCRSSPTHPPPPPPGAGSCCTSPPLHVILSLPLLFLLFQFTLLSTAFLCSLLNAHANEDDIADAVTAFDPSLRLPLRALLLTSAVCWLTPRLPSACNSHPHPSTVLACRFTTHWTTHRRLQLPRCVWSPAALYSTCALLREASPLQSARV